MVKKNFTRKDLSNKIYQNLGFSKNYSSTIIDNFFETLIQELLKSNKIKIINNHNNLKKNYNFEGITVETYSKDAGSFYQKKLNFYYFGKKLRFFKNLYIFKKDF